jgi:hypothetical protein
MTISVGDCGSTRPVDQDREGGSWRWRHKHRFILSQRQWGSSQGSGGSMKEEFRPFDYPIA